MSFGEAQLRRNGSSVIQTMLKRLAEEESSFERLVGNEKQLLERNMVGNVPVETAKPLAKAALY
jgi:hypothetical protein